MVSTRDTLAEKVIDRLCYGQIGTDREAYDFLVAHSFAFEELRNVWDSLDSFEKSRVLKLCQYQLEGSITKSDRAHELNDPHYPNVVDDLGRHVKQMFETDLRYQSTLDRV